MSSYIISMEYGNICIQLLSRISREILMKQGISRTAKDLKDWMEEGKEIFSAR